MYGSLILNYFRLKSVSYEQSTHGTNRDFSVEVINHAFENLPMSQIFSKIIKEKHCSVTTHSFPFHPPLTFEVSVNTFRVNRDERHANHWKRLMVPTSCKNHQNSGGRGNFYRESDTCDTSQKCAVWEQQANYVVGKCIQNVKQQIGSHTK